MKAILLLLAGANAQDISGSCAFYVSSLYTAESVATPAGDKCLLQVDPDTTNLCNTSAGNGLPYCTDMTSTGYCMLLASGHPGAEVGFTCCAYSNLGRTPPTCTDNFGIMLIDFARSRPYPPMAPPVHHFNGDEPCACYVSSLWSYWHQPTLTTPIRPPYPAGDKCLVNVPATNWHCSEQGAEWHRYWHNAHDELENCYKMNHSGYCKHLQ